MLSRSEIKSLQAHREYPSISILAPTHRTAPANKQDPIKVKNLVTKAVKRLHEEFPKREVAPVVANLNGLVKNLDWQHFLDGLALFASREKAKEIHLPFRVKPRAIIDETFATRDLVYSYNRAKPYRILALSHTARLFDAWTDVLEEHTARPFPMEHRGAGGAAKLPGGKGINRSAVRDDAQRAFYRTVYAAVDSLQRAHPLPLVLVGVDRSLAFYREVIHSADSVTAMLAGNHDRTPPAALGKLVWPVVQAASTVGRTEALVQLDQAVSANRHASGIDQVWRAVVTNQCRTLLVEKDFKYPANVAPTGDRLEPFTGKGPAALDDAVDEVIEKVMQSGGDVYFYGPGDLDGHQGIAAIFRNG